MSKGEHMIKSSFKKLLMILLSMSMIMGSALSIASNNSGSQSRSISLNGTVADDMDGYLDSKAMIVSTGMNNSVNYRITPSYSVGSASKVRVYIKLPSLTYTEGKYIQTGVNETPSALGIKGKVNAGNGWIVVGDNESYGGILELEYVGRLGAGSNPAFDIELSTYTDGSDGPYGTMPEGITLEMMGWVSYGSFNDQNDSGWETANKYDSESIVKLIVSNLEWSTQLTNSHFDDEDPVPLWDRYQYASYEYSIKNDSDNLSSLIEGFDVGFDINSNDIHINGIIPFDINRFKYVEGEVVLNNDINDMSGLFIGVEDQGGILIYDITEWDYVSELKNPLPYRYTGSGSIMLEQSSGDNKQEITPEHAPGVSERKYLLKLPLSRQGFPDLPTTFKVIGITNVKFAQGSNWSKTIVNEREITTPSYSFEMLHAAEEKDVVYGYDTHFSISEFLNSSNVPVFKPQLTYLKDDKFQVSHLRFKLPKTLAFEDYLQARFLTYENNDSEDVVLELPETIVTDEDYQYFDITLDDLNDKFIVYFQETLQKKESNPLIIEVYGEAYHVGELSNTALLEYIEKQASNDHLGENTTYTEVKHKLEKVETINVVYPEEVIPNISFKVNGDIVRDKDDILLGYSDYDEPVLIDYYLSTKNEKAEEVVFKADINKDGAAINNVNLILKKALFDKAENVKVEYVNEHDELMTLTYELKNEDILINVNDSVKEFIITMDSLIANDEQLISIEGTMNKGINKTHVIQAELKTYQALPYDQSLTAHAKGKIIINLPQELNPATTIDVYYGDLKSQNVSYESIFDVYFKLDTKNVQSPQSTYTIDLLEASKKGSFLIKDVVIDAEFVKEVIYEDAKGNQYTEFDEALAIQKIIIHHDNFQSEKLVEVAHLRVQASLDMGASQAFSGTFIGNQKAPFLDEKQVSAVSKVTVYDTKTTVEVKGVNQVDEKLGVGNKYSVDIYRHWNRGYTYNTQDYTLDQGYKSLGGFTTSFTRPSLNYANNDQTLTLTTKLPEHFDLYYLKIRDDAKDYLMSVNIYRMVNNEEVLWKEISASDWVYNTSENKYWRINTALYENSEEDLFKTEANSEGVYEHPYFKSAWHEDVNPKYPIVRVDVILDFTRESENHKPQMSGSNTNIIEYMGRFFKTSTAKEATSLVSEDRYGINRDQSRSASASINSLVGYPYAQSSTGAHDNTSLSQKQILMGTIGEYKASIYNKENFRVAYYGGHGPDIYTPAFSEHDEWLQMRDSGFFHDTLIYEFTYPNNPKDDAIYHYDAKGFSIEDTRVLKYLDKVTVHLNDGTSVDVDRLDTQETFNLKFEEGLAKDLIKTESEYTLQLTKGVYPKKIEAFFKHIPGFGENTAEIAVVKEDDLGNLRTVDIRVKGIVNGDKNLVGTSKLYRLQDGVNDKTLVHSSSAVLKGITPKLNAQLSMSYDKTKVYDYQADGLTPNSTTVSLSIENKGEADISEATIKFKPDQNFRAKTVSIPKAIFDERWIVDSVLLDQQDVKDYFVLNGDLYELDLEQLYTDQVLSTKTYQDETTYLLKMIHDIEIKFVGRDDSVRMYGAFSKAELEDDSLESKMLDTTNVFIEGIWVDQSESGQWDYASKPSFVNSSTKANDEVISAYTNFNVSAHVKAYQTIYTSSGSGNQGENPTLTHRSSASNTTAPRLYNRVAILNLSAIHVNEDHEEIIDQKLFYDEDTQKYIGYDNLAVQDHTRLLYRLSNEGSRALSDDSGGHIPLINPQLDIVAPLGLDIKNVLVIDENVDYIDDEHFVLANVAKESLTNKRYTVSFDQTLEYQEALYVLVSFETVNDFSEDLNATQNKPLMWNAYARPQQTHGFRSYNASGQKGHQINGNKDVVFEGKQHALLNNLNYRFANPNQLKIKSQFDKENISGETLSLTVSNIKNELKHSNTQLSVIVKLDDMKEKLKPVQDNTDGGFELTEFPKVNSAEGYNLPQVFFKHKDAWILISDFDEENHDLKDINDLKIDYGIVADDFEAPSFTIKGIGHWKTSSQLNSKYYDLSSSAHLDLVHDENSQYTYSTKDSSRLYKAIAKVELNLQAFDTKEEASGPYEGSKVFKHSYNPSETFFYKISLINHNNNQGLSTNTPYGKADFIEPVIYDKIPEYLSYEDFEIKIYDEHDVERSHIAPEISTSVETGLDVGGKQVFSNNRHNDGYGLLSSAHPVDTKVNPAESINFNLVTFNFKDEVLKRGERIEIVYKVKVRKDNLPYATYPDGRAVWAPFLGWYGDNNPVGNTIKNNSMDMASLLHDVGVSGNKGHELTSEEFLSNSEAWTHGSNAKRKQATNTSSVQSTYYDESANKEKSHLAYMNEEKSNDLHLSFNGALDEVYNYVTRARVNDQKVLSDERIMWAQNGLQLRRAWLYGASEFRVGQERKSHGVDSANFYEHDGSLNHSNIVRHGYTPYDYDDYTYAVQLHERFSVRLHAANLGDRNLEGGLKYTEILPIGISPYDVEGNILSIKAYNGKEEIKDISYKVIQTPKQDEGYRAPAQLQEAGTYQEKYREEIPYVVEVIVPHSLSAWFKGDEHLKYQYVDIMLRVEEEVAANMSLGVHQEVSVWHDELRITPLQEEEYLEIYSHEYGAFTRGLSSSYSQNAKYYKNDAIKEGFELSHAYLSSTNYTTYLSFEPYTMYIRGLNAQNRRLDEKTLVTGDQIAMRKPSLRVWSMPEKVNKRDERYGNIDNFDVNVYDELIIHATIENQQLEVRPEYNRKNEGYNYYSGDNYNDDIWRNTPQTIGGAKGTYFEPTVSITLPKGVSPVLKDMSTSRLYHDEAIYQEIDFTANIYDIVGLHETKHNEDVTDNFDVKVSVQDDRFVLQFTIKEDKLRHVAYDQSLVISPRVRIINNIDDDIEVIAGSKRPVFTPIVSRLYTSGETPSQSARDTNKKVLGRNNVVIAENDRLRKDSTSSFASNMGYLKVSERLIKASERVDDQVVGKTSLRQRQASLHNDTQVMLDLSDEKNDLKQVDPAGRHWYTSELKNEVIKNSNPSVESLSAGDIHHSRFTFSYILSDFAKVTENYRIKIDGKQYLPEQIGYSVQYLKSEQLQAGRQKVIFIVTPEKGQLLTGDSFEFMWEVLMVDGYDDALNEDLVWKSDDLLIDSYISVISDDISVSNLKEEDFVIQDEHEFKYRKHITDKDLGFNVNETDVTDYAYDDTEIEIIKPQLEIRKNTLKPRNLYSNGLTGDNYFKSIDDIEYLINHAEVVGSGVKEFVIEDILPTHIQSESSIQVSRLPLSTKALYASTGTWLFPDKTRAYINEQGKNLDDYFRVFIYYSEDDAIDGYEQENWHVMDSLGVSPEENIVYEFSDSQHPKKIRVILKALNPDELLIPSKTRLAVDADLNTEELERVTEVDPENINIKVHHEGITDNAIRIGVRSLSDASSTLFIYNTAQAWTNYVSDKYVKLDQSETRSYLTPSRPVVNINHTAQYFKYDPENMSDKPYAWSNNTTINPTTLPHLKFKAEVVNANNKMWEEDENNAYEEDILIDPFITVQLPKVMESMQDTLEFVEYETITDDHPLSDNYTNDSGLPLQQANGLWTWYLIRDDQAVASSSIKLVDTYTGPWDKADQNVLSFWFEGNIYPGDRLVVEYIGEVNAYTPGVSNNLKSIAMVSNNTGILSPLNSRKNQHNVLGYTLDDLDFNSNKKNNDRLVFNEKSLFTYEKYDNFGKRKTASSSLNKIGTISPEATPVKEGGIFTYTITVDNSKDFHDNPYIYPIMYDVLPHVLDTEILNSKEERNSQFTGELLLDSIKMEIVGKHNETYVKDKDYTVYVGPFKKLKQEIIAVDLPQDINQDFFEKLKTPTENSDVRDEYFVKLSDFEDLAADRAKEIQSILIMFNDKDYKLVGDSQIVATYDLKARMNAPVWLQESLEGLSQTFEEYTAWNTFVATQKVSRFLPQESNQAGVYVTEMPQKTYLGSYVWNDWNYDGIQNEGESYIDRNGRTLLKPLNGNDPGINGVKVSLRTPTGYPVDELGQAIHFENGQWTVVDEETGTSILDETFLKPIVSSGPLETVTENDYHGNAGYYVFSNIEKRDYRVVYEFPETYDRYSLTTNTIFDDHKLTTYHALENFEIVNDTIDHNRLVAISDAVDLNYDFEDQKLMSFNVGVAHQIKVGGTIFKENPETLDGFQDKTEKGIKDYHIYVKEKNGEQALDINGKPLVTRSDKDGNYHFMMSPFNREYYFVITDEHDTYTKQTVVSPFIHNVNPFADDKDNDAYTIKGKEEILTNILDFNLEALYESKFKDRLSVSIGVYDKSDTAVIGNRVWDDVNKNGIQDENEKGLANQSLFLEQYYLVDDTYIKTDYSQETRSSKDGYYYFKNVPTNITVDNTKHLALYKVIIKDLIPSYNISLNHVGDDISIDNNFLLSGKFHDDEYLVVADYRDGVYDFYEPINDNTIDLGLHSNELSEVSGLIFNDKDETGINTHHELVEDVAKISLEVKWKGSWQNVYYQDGVMVSPSITDKSNLVKAEITSNQYHFENLLIVDSMSNEILEYRIKIEEIPLWYKVSDYQKGDDISIDSDFKEVTRDKYIEVVSHEFVLNPLLPESLLGIDTFNPGHVKNIDLGLSPYLKTRQIGDRLWIDKNQDGLQDDSEQPLVNQELFLYEVVDNSLVPVIENDTKVSVKTDENGKYEFSVAVSNYNKSLENYNKTRDYVVVFNRQSQYLPTAIITEFKDINSDFIPLKDTDYKHEIDDVDHTLISRVADITTLDSNGYIDYSNTYDDLSIDGGLIEYKQSVKLGGYLWFDENQDGIKDDLEEPIENRKVTLEKFNTELQKWEAVRDSHSDELGYYEFEVAPTSYDRSDKDYLEPYLYRVTIEREVNERWSIYQSKSLDIVNRTQTLEKRVGVSDSFEVFIKNDISSVRDDLSMGTGIINYKEEVIVGGIMWHDENANGLIDDEERLEKQVITLQQFLDDEWITLESTETDEFGHYEFSVIPTSYDEDDEYYLKEYTYRVIAYREGYESWTIFEEQLDNTIQNLENHLGYSTNFSIFEDGNINSATNDLEKHIGKNIFAYQSKISGIYWDDHNKDGLIDSQEQRLAEREVYLWKYDVKLEEYIVEEETVTDEDGYYEFIVALTNYDFESDEYLKAYEYIVTAKRMGHELWTLVSNEDLETDNKLTEWQKGEGISSSINLMEDDNIATVSEFNEMHIGINTYQQYVTIGDRVTLDEVNGKGLENVKVSLEIFDETLQKWISTSDVNGNKNTYTDSEGYYSFVVTPLIYDLSSENYLEELKYRTRVEDKKAYTIKGPDVSQPSKLVIEGDAEILSRTVDDFSLDFIFTKNEENVKTGVNQVANVGVLLSSLFISSSLLLILRKRKRNGL